MPTETSFKLNNLRNRVRTLKNRETRKREEAEAANKSIQDIQDCLVYLDGILETHRALDIPKHTSGKSLFFFKTKSGASCLIKELHPSPEFMPEMRRVPVAQTKTRKMKSGDVGFVIQRVLFSYPDSKHELVLFCPKRCVVEKI
ncbi:MAG: hypothetical protein RLZZ517_450 [Candidatus Parcubacteria bacterium]|jgi:hypothetical protein